jgi:hypothetical protein
MGRRGKAGALAEASREVGGGGGSRETPQQKQLHRIRQLCAVARLRPDDFFRPGGLRRWFASPETAGVEPSPTAKAGRRRQPTGFSVCRRRLVASNTAKLPDEKISGADRRDRKLADFVSCFWAAQSWPTPSSCFEGARRIGEFSVPGGGADTGVVWVTAGAAWGYQGGMRGRVAEVTKWVKLPRGRGAGGADRGIWGESPELRGAARFGRIWGSCFSGAGARKFNDVGVHDMR